MARDRGISSVDRAAAKIIAGDAIQIRQFPVAAALTR